MSDMQELLGKYGQEIAVDPITNTGTVFYKFPEGHYHALVGDLHITYKNAENNKCEKNDPGAQAAFGMQEFIIIVDPSGKRFVDENGKVVDADYGAYIWRQYIPLEGEKQWQNKNVYDSFYIDGEDVSVIKEDGSGNYDVRLAYAALYVGIRCTFEIKVSAKGTTFMVDLALGEHNLNKDLLEKRKALVANLHKQIADRKPEKKVETKEEAKPVEDVKSADDLLSNLTNG